mgnify:CR=1 FL=1
MTVSVAEKQVNTMTAVPEGARKITMQLGRTYIPAPNLRDVNM